MDLTKANNMLLIGGAVGLVAFFLWLNAKGAQGAARSIVGGAIGLAGDVAAGTVVGVGEALGIPATDKDKCAAARASGTLLDVSAYCPLTEYLAETGKRAAGVLTGERSISIF